MDNREISTNRISFLTLLLILLIVYAHSQIQEGKKLPFSLSQFKLENGLHVILSEDYSLPLVSVVLAYNVGSINEPPGKAGLAYLLEGLMMYHGSRNVDRMQHIGLIHRIGGEVNAGTGADKAIFLQKVPSNWLASVLWLESDRMYSLDINPANVERAKEDVIGIIRNRKQTNYYLESFHAFDELLFPGYAYGHPVLGNETDLKSITVEDVKNFYSTYYTPNNAILSIAGNIDPTKAEKLVRKYFETIPKGKEVPAPPEPEPYERKPVVKVIEDSLASLPGFLLGYRIASPYSDDFYALKLIEYILSKGNSSRLFKRLIKKELIVSDIRGQIETKGTLAAFKIYSRSSNDILREKSQKAVLSEINKLKSTLISDKELRKSKNMLKKDYISRYATSMNRARFLAEKYLARKTLDDLPGELERYLRVSSSEIAGIMNRYFTEDKVLLVVKIK